MGKRDERKGLRQNRNQTRGTNASADKDTDAQKKKKRKVVSERVKAKRFLEFELRNAAAGDEDAQINKQWSEHYDRVLGREERLRVQAALARKTQPYIVCTVFPKLGFPLSLTTKLARISEASMTIQDSSSETFFIKVDRIGHERLLQQNLDRESRLERCLLKRSTPVLFALRELFSHFESGAVKTFLDTQADYESRQAVIFGGLEMTSTLIIPCKRAIPPFEYPSSIWFQGGNHVETIFPWGDLNTEGESQAGDELFDAVLFRCPSSRDASFEGQKNAWKEWRANHARDLRSVQIKLLANVLQRTKKNGYVLFFTNSINPEENEKLIRFVLGRSKGAIELCKPNFPAVSSYSLSGDDFDSEGRFIRVHPQSDFANGSGFCMCVLRKTRSNIDWSFAEASDPELATARDLLLRQGFFTHQQQERRSEMDGLDIDATLSLGKNLVALTDGRSRERVVIATKRALDFASVFPTSPVRVGAMLVDEEGMEERSVWVLASSEAVHISSLAFHSLDEIMDVLSKRKPLDIPLSEHEKHSFCGVNLVELRLDENMKSSSGNLELSDGTGDLNDNDAEHRTKKVRMSKSMRRKLKKTRNNGETTDIDTEERAAESSKTDAPTCRLLVVPSSMDSPELDTKNSKRPGDWTIIHSEDWLESCKEVFL